MYGGGLTSYEAARRSIEKYGLDNTEIWFADTRTEDRDLYRFNRDVQIILGKEITVFDQGKDIWDVFFEMRALGNSRMDPCSKYLKRKPLREELESRFSLWKCRVCGVHTSETPNKSKVKNALGKWEYKNNCAKCLDSDEEYGHPIQSLRELVSANQSNSDKALEYFSKIDQRLEPADELGRTARIVLGMDRIEDCDRVNRAMVYWTPFRTWFPLDEPPVAFKERIMQQLIDQGVKVPRLYDLGFKHNNCGGFCVKAGLGQIAHFYKMKPGEFTEYERKEQEFRDTINPNVSIFSKVVNGKKQPFTMKQLRESIDAGDKFKFEPSMACSCLNPVDADG